MRGTTVIILAFVLLSGCSTALIGADETQISDAAGKSVTVGSNAVGEVCSQRFDSTRSASIYCGTWEQPSARISSGGTVGVETLSKLATQGVWRMGLDERFQCGDPVPTTLLGEQPTVLLECTRRIGGWPHLAIVTLVNSTAWYLDGVNASLPVMARSLAIMTGQSNGERELRVNGADALLATRLAAMATKSGDIGEYEHLMTAGTRANLSDSPVAAERAFRAALTLQKKALGAGNPNTADPARTAALESEAVCAGRATV